MLLNRFGRVGRRGDDEEEEDEEDQDFLDDFDEDEDEDDDGDWSNGPKQWYELVKEPQLAGINLERSGLFSRVSFPFPLSFYSFSRNYSPPPLPLSIRFHLNTLKLKPNLGISLPPLLPHHPSPSLPISTRENTLFKNLSNNLYLKT